jgi:steroid delta-isomerase-like uncharacterized protein
MSTDCPFRCGPANASERACYPVDSDRLGAHHDGARVAKSAEDVARESIECYNAGDFDRLRSLLADDFYEEELATQRRVEGADARVETAQGWKQAFPDEQGTITGVYTSGNTVAMEITWEGTQSGPMPTPDGQELPPSNKRTTVKSVQVIETEDGKMKALRTYFDLMTLLQQIGAMDQAWRRR